MRCETSFTPYDGSTTPVEKMHLEYQRLLSDFPDLKARLDVCVANY